MPELVDLDPAGHEEAGDSPAGVADGVVQWSPYGAIRTLNVGPAIDELAGDISVVAARGPMQWRLGTRLGIS